MRRPRIRFWQKVLTALLIVGVAPIALVSFISIQGTRNDLTNLGVTNIKQRSISTANAIDAYLQSRLGDIVLVAKLPDIVRYAQNFGDQGARAAARTALPAAAARSPAYERAAAVDGAAPGLWARKVQREQAASVTNKPIAPIDPDTVKKVVADKRFGQKAPDQLVIEPLPTLKTALDALPKGVSGGASFAFGAGVDEQRGVVTRLLTKPWGYVLAVPLTTYTKAADNATFDAALMLVMGVLLSFVIGVVLTRSLVGPLRRLVGEATQVSTGDIDLREARFDTRSGDDITHEVASAFDRMLNALRFYALSDQPGSGGEE